jgi:hypothetical protein
MSQASPTNTSIPSEYEQVNPNTLVSEKGRPKKWTVIARNVADLLGDVGGGLREEKAVGTDSFHG